MSCFMLVLQLTLVLASSSQSHQKQQTCIIPNPFLPLQPDSCIPTQTIPLERPRSTYRTVSPVKKWKSTGLCRGVRADKFCVFTHASFNNGEGVSVITTGNSISTIATRPAFKDENGGAVPSSTVPYQEVEIEGKGIGLVATRMIRAGELIMALTPGIMVNENAIQKLGRKTVSELLIGAVDELPSQHKESLLNLSTHSAASDYGDKIYRILQTNSFRTGYHDGDNPFYSLFTEVSRLNHDCRPNCAYYFDHLDFHQKVIAVRDIMAGEELTIAYYDPIQIQSVRQEKLHKEWGFRCACKRCTADASSIAESDSRVEQIIVLRKELDDHSATSKASPEKAELLVSLYEEEGILTRVNEAYYRAAIEYIGVGDIENAEKYARLCIDHGRKFIGSDRPLVEDMQELIANPTGYSKWKFRLKSG
ncbi:SET domain-containing protein [Annulohypoxylon maeteangense]|uniref:SET domain-containing protein n=1 Tax=Annulohypoxylon maeteangense TaxID=1927788 RepID=UPI0020086081|nr:SET domain-containing protein [Annulohypoxylon maeteangense]KAI0884311.1 SET domain-containing protein [Annulohypoxylon maeteangense]